MKNILVRGCTHQDLEGIWQLEDLWKEEDVSYVWYGKRDSLVADFERFPKYFIVAETEDRKSVMSTAQFG